MKVPNPAGFVFGPRIFSQYVPRLIVHEERRSNIAGFLDQSPERIADIVVVPLAVALLIRLRWLNVKELLP